MYVKRNFIHSIRKDLDKWVDGVKRQGKLTVVLVSVLTDVHVTVFYI